MTTVTLIGRSGCHLCEVAHEIVDRVLETLPAAAAERVDVVEKRLEDEPGLEAIWGERIPVVLIDGAFHSQWRIAPDPFRTALLTAAGAPEETA